jgi:Fe-S-cluster-containing dehydrogenase component
VRYGLVVDLSHCVGCYSCAMACKSEHATTPGIWWNRVLAREMGKFPTAQLIYIPMACMHCDNPPCVKACPTGASHKRQDGIVIIDPTKCIGCRYCMSACPYNARSFYEAGRTYYPGKGPSPFEVLGASRHLNETVEKCDLCAELVDQGQQPACVEVCPTYARVFGDLDDPKSEVSRLIQNRKAIQLLPNLGTKPKVYYIPPKNSTAAAVMLAKRLA